MTAAGRAVDIEAADDEAKVEDEAGDDPEEGASKPNRCITSRTGRDPTLRGPPTSVGARSLGESDVVDAEEAVLLEARSTVEIGSRAAFEERARLRSSMTLTSSGWMLNAS